MECKGCKYDIPGDCANRDMGEDGYWHFPEGDCWEEIDETLDTQLPQNHGGRL